MTQSEYNEIYELSQEFKRLYNWSVDSWTPDMTYKELKTLLTDLINKRKAK